MNFLERSFDQTNRWWRYAIVCLGALVVFPAIGTIPLTITILLSSPSTGEGINAMSGITGDLSATGISKNLMLVMLMLSTVITLALTVPLVRMLHGRKFSEVINGTAKIRFDRCLTGGGVWFVLMAMMYAADYLVNGEDYILQFDASRFIPLVAISILLIPFQTTSEEFLFRGYLAQGVAAWSRRPWVALVVPSVVFGLMHAFNPEVIEYGFWATMPQYIYIGLFLGLVAVLDDGIELSIGIHAANNIFLSIFATSGSSVFQTDALLEVININPGKDSVLVIVMSLFAGAYFARKYNWDFSLLLKKL